MDEFKNNIIENLSINKLIKVHKLNNLRTNDGIISYMNIVVKEKEEKKYPKYLTHQPILFKEKIPEIKTSTFEDYRDSKLSVDVNNHLFTCKRKIIEIKNSPEFSNSLSKLALIHELNHDLTKEVIERIFKFGEFTNKMFLTKWQNFLVSIVKKIKFIKYNPKIKIYNNNKILYIILALSNLIAIETREGPGSYVIMNSYIVSLIQEYIRNFKVVSSQIIYPAGIIDNINILVNPCMEYNDCRLCVGSLSDNIGVKAIIKDITMYTTYDGFNGEKEKLSIDYTIENVGGELCKLKYKTVNLDIKI